MDDLGRFQSKIVVHPGGCWIWNASRHKDGYGWYCPVGRGKAVLAHRWSYSFFVGPIPDGMCVLHTCDEPPCANPDHLFCGTQADNVVDCERKGRRNQSRVRKLTPGIRAEIRELHSRGDVSYAELGRRYGVTYQTIRHHVLRGV